MPQTPAPVASMPTRRRTRRPRLWRADFRPVDARARRLGRLALALCEQLGGSGRPGASRRLSESAALLSLLLPLVDPDALARWVAARRDALEPETVNLFSAAAAMPEAFELDGDDVRQLLASLLRDQPGTTHTRLHAADGQLPVSPSVRLLIECLSLDRIEAQLLDYLDQHFTSESLREMLRECSRASPGINRERLAGVLAVPVEALALRLRDNAPLRRLGLLDYEAESDLEDFLRPTPLLRRVLDLAPETVEALLDLLIESAPAASWTLQDFPHLSAQQGLLAGTLRQAVVTGAPGVNALFYGPSGTGKTEFARALAAAQGLRVYQVRSSDEDGDGLSRQGRLAAYLVAQQLLARRRDALLLFDEVEDVFDPEPGLLSLLRPRATGRQKGWINRILEENPVPAIWITNDTAAMDAAFLRRFLLPLGFTTPPRSVRRQMAERHLGNLGVSPPLLDTLAADARLTPAQYGAARRLVLLRSDVDPDDVTREGIAAQRRLLHGAPAPRVRAPATAFDAAFLNLDGDLTPARILAALQRRGHGTLCFYGPPGTGKTQFAEVLAEALDLELIARQASDLVSPFVGETEQNLARLFRETDPGHSLILLDEVDSFLADRQGARHSWERTQVNELLQQMERYAGVFIAATNRMQGIDAAALRRFDFKLHFRALTPVQRLRLFAREALGDEQAEVPPLIARHLHALEQLTAGDFATACRQRALLDEALTPEQFLRRLVAECRLKQPGQISAD